MKILLLYGVLVGFIVASCSHDSARGTDTRLYNEYSKPISSDASGKMVWTRSDSFVMARMEYQRKVLERCGILADHFKKRYGTISTDQQRIVDDEQKRGYFVSDSLYKALIDDQGNKEAVISYKDVYY
jgi:hypothetical protein